MSCLLNDFRAGAYINTARQLPGGSKYGFHDYLRDYEKDFRKVTATSLLTRKSGSGVKMRFDQFTNMSELGEKVHVPMPSSKRFLFANVYERCYYV